MPTNELHAGKWTAASIANLISDAKSLDRGLSTEAAQLLLENGVIRHFEKGATIMERVVGPPRFYLCLSGTARLMAFNDQGKEFVSVFLEPGNIFGVRACLDNMPDTHDARAERDCEILVIGANAVRELMWKNREIHEGLIEILCKRLRVAMNVMEQLATWSPKQRLAWRILDIIKSQGIVQSGKQGSSISISQDALASMIALSRQRTNKLLKEFEQENIIKIEYNSIQILNTNQLEKYLKNLCFT
ncbi:MAG: Crp/Fnr family transcriptional regulator [Notoacmeibacter sp.]|nr:Crp/Fnr family transcriptional regulator [Notoacmeibacter sp.]